MSDNTEKTVAKKQLFHVRDFYVAIQLDGDVAEIKGGTNREKVENTPEQDFGHGPTIAIKFEELMDIETFINHIVFI